MITLMMKGIFCLSASFLLAATTSMDALCAALRKIHVPGTIVTLLLLTYRYISVMLEELSVMTTAYKLRAPGQKGIAMQAWGSLAGQLLLRAMDRAGQLYESMRLRGFQGEFDFCKDRQGRLLITDTAYLCGWGLLLTLIRFIPIMEWIGQGLERFMIGYPLMSPLFINRNTYGLSPVHEKRFLKCFTDDRYQPKLICSLA
jgi:cobalt/nickel transport system permease protein